MINFVKAIKIICATFSALTSMFGIKPNHDKKYTYVSLGDSMSTGFGFDDYYIDDEIIPVESMEHYRPEDGHKNVHGFLREAKEAYPTLVHSYLKDKYGEENVEHIQLAVNVTRIDDIYYHLNKDAKTDEFYQALFEDNGHGDQWNDVFANRARQFGYTTNEDNNEAVVETYVNSIKKADLITLNAGFNNFGCFFSGKLGDIIEGLPIAESFGGHDTLQGFLDRTGVDLNIGEVYEQINDIFHSYTGLDLTSYEKVKVGGYNINVKYLLELIVTAFASYCYYMNETTKLIYELNPDVELVVIGLFNILKGIKLSVNDITIDVGEITSKIFELVNLHTALGTECSNKYKFVDSTDLNVGIHAEDIANGTMDEEQVRRAYIGLYTMAKEVGVDIPTFTIVKDQINGAMINLGNLDFDISEYIVDEDENPLTDAEAYETKWLASSLVFGEENANSINSVLNEYYGVIDSLFNVLKRATNSKTVTLEALSSLGESISVEQINNGDFDGLINIYVRIVINNGMWSHPNEEGHIEISKAVIETLESHKTAKEVGEERIRNILTNITSEIDSLVDELKTQIGIETKTLLVKFIGEKGYEKVIEVSTKVYKLIKECIRILNFIDQFLSLIKEYNPILYKFIENFNGNLQKYLVNPFIKKILSSNRFCNILLG